MSLTGFSIRNTQFTAVVFLCLILLGLYSFHNIPRSEDPELKVPSYRVVVIYPGVDAQDLEKLIAKPIEDTLAELDDVEKIDTTVRDGSVNIQIDFFYGVDPERKYDEVIRQVNAERENLPSDIYSIDIHKYRTSNVAMLQVGLLSETASYARLQDQAELLRKTFERVEGVRRSERHAFPEKQVHIELNLEKIRTLNVSIESLYTLVGQNNLNIPGGSLEMDTHRFNIKTRGIFNDLSEIENLPVRVSKKGVLTLGDIADIRWGYADNDYHARFNGQRCVFVTVMPRDGGNIFPIRERLLDEIERYKEILPSDMRLEIGFDQSSVVAERLSRLEHDFLIAFVLVLLTVLPLGLKAAVLVMLSIPISLAMGISALLSTGFTLNQLSIVGFVIALGLLVDDSIVVVENISRFRREGHSAVDAALKGTRQIAVAVMGTTATLLFAFLPLMMLPGGPGQFIRTMPVSVIYTVLASLFVSLTLIPVLASFFFKGKADSEGNVLLRWLQKTITLSYRPILHWCMRHRLMTILGCLILTICGLSLLPVVGFSLFPKAGMAQFLIRIEAEEGASITQTNAITHKVEAVLEEKSEIAVYMTNVGSGNPQIYYNEIQSNRKANTAEIFAALKEYSPTWSPAFFQELQAELSRIPGARIIVKEFENGPPIEAPVAVRIFSEDLGQLRQMALQTETALKALKGTLNVNNPIRMQRTDFKVDADPTRMQGLGLTQAELDRSIRLAISGIEVSRFRENDGEEYPIMLQLPGENRAGYREWESIQVSRRDGTWIPIREIATLELASALPLIKHFNRQRSITVSAYVQDGYNVDRITQQLDGQLHTLQWPKGCYYAFGGEVESRKESFGGIGSAIIIAACGILAILILEFRSFRGTLIVASVIPLGFVGGVIGLFLSGYSLSFTAAIGFVALIGIEIKNSILLVDFTNQLRAEGMPLMDAIEQAGEIRFLPVVLTTLTALGALTPLALQQSGLYSPLAIVIIGGLISSLLLSRLLTPVLYSLITPPMPRVISD
jgi:multidrug efflux pump subunit AcrB